MSSENVELVRSIYEDWERGDYTRVDWADPELALVSVDGPEPGYWSGLAAVAEQWRTYLSTWNDLRAEAEEYHEIDSERVLVLARNKGVAKTSGVDLAQIGDSANVFHIRGGKVRKLILYWDRDRALVDLGIRSEDE
jgi:ketosteroid isomerase-like protein